MGWVIDCMGGFRIILSKSSGNRFFALFFLHVAVNFISQYRFRGRRLGVNSFE